MNEQLAELKARLRKVEDLLAEDETSSFSDRVTLAQAVSRARRLVRHEDRTRAPTADFRASVERAELLAKLPR